MTSNHLLKIFLAAVLPAACASNSPEPAPEEAGRSAVSEEAAGGWIDLFDGETLDGWTASENKETFSVQDGAIIAHGPRSHLFYTGPVGNHDFKDFEFRAEVMTTPGSNSGMYFHTAYQEEGWPAKGYEAQINNTGSDARKTGSLYAVDDVLETKAADNEWFTQHVIVQGKRIIVKVNDETVVDYTEPDEPERNEEMAERLLSSGTVALQGHDPESRVLFRNIQVRFKP